MYEELKRKWQMKYITAETLQGWVKLEEAKPGKGITQAQYEEIIALPQVGVADNNAALREQVTAYEEALTTVGVLPLEG